MVKRLQHIGTFLHNEMGSSLRGISPRWGRSSIHLQKVFFLRSIASLVSVSPRQGQGLAEQSLEGER
jgi:hypothetical protein